MMLPKVPLNRPERQVMERVIKRLEWSRPDRLQAHIENAMAGDSRRRCTGRLSAKLHVARARAAQASRPCLVVRPHGRQFIPAFLQNARQAYGQTHLLPPDPCLGRSFRRQPGDRTGS